MREEAIDSSEKQRSQMISCAVFRNKRTRAIWDAYSKFNALLPRQTLRAGNTTQMRRPCEEQRMPRCVLNVDNTHNEENEQEPSKR